jgi:hypothetical protein
MAAAAATSRTAWQLCALPASRVSQHTGSHRRTTTLASRPSCSSSHNVALAVVPPAPGAKTRTNRAFAGGDRKIGHVTAGDRAVGTLGGTPISFTAGGGTLGSELGSSLGGMLGGSLGGTLGG